MPDLGKYADTVLAAYGLSLGLILVLVAVTLWHGARVRRALSALEQKDE